MSEINGTQFQECNTPPSALSGYIHRALISLNRGYTKDGFAEKVYHIHLRFSGDNHELYFRDYLNEHPQIAKEYEKLKLGLWKEYEHDRDAYTNAKTEFIIKWTKEARREQCPPKKKKNRDLER